jgi:hypothetical protein
MTFGIGNIRSLYRAGSQITVLKQLFNYKFDLVGIQKIRWDRGGTELAGEEFKMV